MYRSPKHHRPALAAGGVLAVGVLLAGTMPANASPADVLTAVPGQDPQAFTAHGEVLNILPPGSNGNVSLTTLASLGVTQAPSVVSTPGRPQG